MSLSRVVRASSSSLIYLNHSGTSYPKPKSVSEAVASAYSQPPSYHNHNFPALVARVERFFGVDSGSVIITPSCTAALSAAIDILIPKQKTLTDSVGVVSSGLEHEALAGPIRRAGCKVYNVSPRMGNNSRVMEPLDLEKIYSLIENNPAIKLLAFSHASNVTGDLLIEASQLAELGRVCKTRNIKILLDGAQTVGNIPIDFPSLNIDAFAFGGHKGLLAPLGIGGLILRCKTDREKISYCDVGSVNMPALHGLVASMDEWNETIPKRRRDLANLFRDRVAKLDKRIHVLGAYSNPSCSKTSTVSICIEDLNPQHVAHWLESERSIIVSGGLHCAPEAHETLGTYTENGAVRFSFGCYNTENDVEAALEGILACIKSLK